MKTALQMALDLAVRANGEAVDAVSEADTALRKARRTAVATEATYAALATSVRLEYQASLSAPTRETFEEALDALLQAKSEYTRKYIDASACDTPGDRRAAFEAAETFETLREKFVETYGGAS